MATVRELYNALGELLDTSAGDEVYSASQPSWPMEYQIAGIKVAEFPEDHPYQHDPEDRTDNCFICGEEPEHKDHEKTTRIYVVEGSQLGYLPEGAAEEIGWRNRGY